MDFIIKRRVRQMKAGERKVAVAQAIREPVLYAYEAHIALKKHLDGEFAYFYQHSDMRIVKLAKTNDYYWIRQHDNLYFAVKIGVRSQIVVTPNLTFGGNVIRADELGAFSFEEIPMSMTLEIPLKDCHRQTDEKTELYLSVFYDADERTLSLQTLNLRGIEIKNFPHDYWNVSTIECDGYPDTGCCGSVRYVRASKFPEMNFGGLEIYDTIDLWTGSKILKVFRKDDTDFTIEQMLSYWKKFWKICGY